MTILYSNQLENNYCKIKNIIHIHRKRIIYFFKEYEFGNIIYYISVGGNIYYLSLSNFLKLIEFCIFHNITFSFSKSA